MEPIKVERELVWFFAGLDPSGYRQAMARSDQHEDEAMLGGAAVSDEERYKDCDRLKVPCPACSKQIIVDSVFMGVVSTDEIITRDRSDNFPSLHFTSLPFPKNSARNCESYKSSNLNSGRLDLFYACKKKGI